MIVDVFGLASARKTHQHPPAVIVFPVIDVDYKSNLFIIDGSIDGDRYLQNFEDLISFLEELDRTYGSMGWIFQQNCAPAQRSTSTME
jgi:hypothetical protein